jgi:hypothetical protein
MRLIYKAAPGAALVPEDLEEEAGDDKELKKARGLPMDPPPSPNRDPYPYAGQLNYGGLHILVENPAGSIRRGRDAGKPWAQKMTAHYGEIAGTIGADGDPVDVFVGPQAGAPIAYVIHSKIPGTEVFDEDKVIVGCPSMAAAEELFRANYGRPGFHGGVTAWPLVELVAYLADPEHKGKRLDRPRRVMRIMLGKALRGGVFTWLLKAAQLGLFGGPSPRPPLPPPPPRRPAAPKPAQPRIAAKTAEQPDRPQLFGPRPTQGGPQAPDGFLPIPGSKHGGFHRAKAGGGFDYWYPEQGMGDGHHEDRDIVEGAPIGRLIDAEGKTSDVRGYRSTLHSPNVHTLDFSDNDRIGPGSIFYTPEGEARLRVDAASGDKFGRKFEVHDLSTATTTVVDAYRLHRAVNDLHEGPRKVIQAQKREALTKEIEPLPARIQKALASFHANPGEVALAQVIDEIVELQSRAERLGLNGDSKEMAALLGFDQTHPTSWSALCAEHYATKQVARALYPGSDEYQGLLSGYMSASAATERLIKYPEMVKAMRLRYLNGIAGDTWNLRRSFPDAELRTVSLTAVIAAMRGKEPTEDAVIAAVKKAGAAKGYSLRKNNLKRLRIGDDYGTKPPLDGTPEAIKDSVSYGALLRYFDERPHLETLVVEAGHADAADRPPTTSTTERHTENAYVAAALKLAAKAAGADKPCPELYGEGPVPEVSVDAVRAALPEAAKEHHKYLEADEPHKAEAMVRARDALSSDRMMRLSFANGRKKKSGSGTSSWEYDDSSCGVVPLSMAIAAYKGEATRKLAEAREDHQARTVKLRSQLAAVASKVGALEDVQSASVRAWAASNGYDPEQVEQHFKASGEHKYGIHGAKELWSRGYDVWARLHPDKNARLSLRYSKREEVPDEEYNAVTRERMDFCGRFRDGVGAPVLDEIKRRLGHSSDLTAAVAAVHEPVRPKNLTEESHAPYPMEQDPGQLRKLLGWMSKDVVPHVDIAVRKDLKNDRAHCGWNNAIALHAVPKEGSYNSTLFHEYGHAIEHDHPDIRDAANTLRDSRSEGEKITNLHEFHKGRGYDDHEVSYRDKWRDEYTGKWYGHLGSTEVLSMGVEALFADPVGFQAADPDHFHFTLGALSGLLGTRKKSVHRSQGGPQ